MSGHVHAFVDPLTSSPSADRPSREPLDAVLFRRGALGSAQATSVVRSVASALDELHAAGALHGDVRPRNIALDEHRGAVLLPAIATQPGSDQRYTAPDRLMGRPATAQDDIYSLGLVAYEMVAGRPAHSNSEDAARTQARIITGAPRLADEVPGVSLAVSDAVARATARNETARYATAGAFALELGRAVRASDPTEVMARPANASMQRVRWPTPARWMVAAIAVVLVLGVLNVMSAVGGTRAPTSPTARATSAQTTRVIATRATPNVVGMAWRDAAKLLRERGFRDDIEVTADGSAAGTRGSVVRQAPAAGAAFRQGDRAKLFVVGPLGD
jgi:hypothetical protein